MPNLIESCPSDGDGGVGSAIIINNKVNIYYEACDNNGNWQIMLAREI